LVYALNMQVKTEAQIYQKLNKSGTVSYRVDLGIVNGKRKMPCFKTEQEAIEAKRKADHEIRAKHPMALADLSRVLRYDALGAMEKLKPYGATLTEAVAFYIKHAKPPKPSITFQEAIDEFNLIKGKAGRSSRYLESAADYFHALRDHFKNCLVTKIDFKQAEAYIYAPRHQWGSITRGNHLRHANLLFNFLTDRGYISEGLNPFAKVPKPKKVESRIVSLSVEVTTKLLQHTLDAGNNAECACMALVFFCGVRVEEAQKMRWDKHIDLKKGVVEITADIAKKGRRRANKIPVNAFEWLRLCCKRDTAPPNTPD